MAFSFLIEDIERGTGTFSLDNTYLINNATDEDIEVWWSKEEPRATGAGRYFIKAGEKGGPYPEFLAYHIIKALVSREMQKAGMAKFFGSAEHRRPYEEKYLIKVENGAGEDPFTAQIREQERAKLLAEMQNQPVADGAYTSSEKRRKAAGKKSHTDEEFAGANL